MSQKLQSSKRHTYVVDFDSDLGMLISNYVDRCRQCNQAVRDFIMSLPQKYAFPISVDEHTGFCVSDDCDAGGLLSISIPKSSFDVMSADLRTAVLWDCIDDDGSENVHVFPRMECQSHFVKYGTAVSLSETNPYEWEFMKPTVREKSKGLQIHAVRYEDVRRKISRQDIEGLGLKPGVSPSASMRLAFGKKYVLNDELVCGRPDYGTDAKEEYFAEARSLYDEWMSIPSVPANTIARILHLTSHDSSYTDGCFCEWHKDAENHRFVIETNLVSSLVSGIREL